MADIRLDLVVFCHVSLIWLYVLVCYRCEAKSRTGCHGYREGELSVIDAKPLNRCEFGYCLLVH